jgi:hypothetical protein
MFYREGQAVKNPSLKGLWAAPKGTAQGTRKNNKRKLILSLCLAPFALNLICQRCQHQQSVVKL